MSEMTLDEIALQIILTVRIENARRVVSAEERRERGEALWRALLTPVGGMVKP
jgi:hypothetical protein